MKLYVASSWRNSYYSTVVRTIKDKCPDFDVYDFRNPAPGNNGFKWSEIDKDWENWSASDYIAALNHPLAVSGYRFDMNAMMNADVCVLVLPCGRSAHLELGWFAGRGKATCILHTEKKTEPELMVKMCDVQLTSVINVVYWLQNL